VTGTVLKGRDLFGSLVLHTLVQAHCEEVPLSVVGQAFGEKDRPASESDYIRWARSQGEWQQSTLRRCKIATAISGQRDPPHAVDRILSVSMAMMLCHLQEGRIKEEEGYV
jgi:hypothetical protein